MAEVHHLYCPIKMHKNQKSACTYYRVEVPFYGLSRMYGSEVFIDEGRMDVERSYQMLFSSDIDLFYAIGGDGVLAAMEAVHKLPPGYAEDGVTMRYPPSIVYDIDDNLDYVHPFNNTYSQFGIRNWDGQELNAGDELIVPAEDGREIVLWKDLHTRGEGDEVFDIENNKKYVRSIHNTVKKADGATFPTKHLGEWYKENYGIDDYYVFPNTVIPHHYPDAEVAPIEGEVRVVWQGGSSHAPDWHPVMDATIEIAKKYPQVKFILWGTPYPPLIRALPQEQVEFIPWQDYMTYKPWRVLVNGDINLCPLKEGMFNVCKSAIKWYEGSILKRPEATLAANVIPYNEEIVDGETGLLYDDSKDYFEKFSKLIEDADLRKRLASNAKDWVLENRHWEKTTPGLMEYYQHLREKKEFEYRDPKLISVGANGNGINNGDGKNSSK